MDISRSSLPNSRSTACFTSSFEWLTDISQWIPPKQNSRPTSLHKSSPSKNRHRHFPNRIKSDLIFPIPLKFPSTPPPIHQQVLPILLSNIHFSLPAFYLHCCHQVQNLPHLGDCVSLQSCPPLQSSCQIALHKSQTLLNLAPGSLCNLTLCPSIPGQTPHSPSLQPHQTSPTSSNATARVCLSLSTSRDIKDPPHLT